MAGIVNITADGSTGMLLFCDADGIDQTCSYKDEVVSLPDGAGPLQVEDEVEFEVSRTGTLWVESSMPGERAACSRCTWPYSSFSARWVSMVKLITRWMPTGHQLGR